MKILSLYEIRNRLASGLSIYDIPLAVTFYARVSTDKYEQLNSLENQVGYYEKFIRENTNWKYIPGYIDEGISGTSTKNRTSFKKMIEDAKDNRFNMIITKEISRFARDTLDSIQYTRKLLEYGVGVFFQTDNINTFDSDSELKLTIMASIAQEEVRKLSERVKFGFRRSIENGRVLGNNFIWGYKKDKCKLVIVEDEAKIIKRIFDLYVNAHVGMRTIGHVLAKEEILNKNGQPFTQGTIKNILTNPKYKGYYCGNKTKVIDYHSKEKVNINEEDWKIYKDYENVPPIVDENIWEKAQKIIKSRSEKLSIDKKVYQNRYPFSGKIFCMDHNKTYRRKVNVSSGKKRKKIVSWRCSEFLTNNKECCNSPIIYEEELKEIVGKEILNNLSNTNIIDELIENYKEVENKRNYVNEIEIKKQEIATLEKKKERMLNLILDGLIKKDDFKIQSDEIINKIHVLQEEVNHLENQNNKRLEQFKYLEDIRKKAKEKLKYENADIDSLIYEFLERIEVYKEENNIRLKIILNTLNDFSVNLKDKKHPLCTYYTYD